MTGDAVVWKISSIRPGIVPFTIVSRGRDGPCRIRQAARTQMCSWQPGWGVSHCSVLAGCICLALHCVGCSNMQVEREYELWCPTVQVERAAAGTTAVLRCYFEVRSGRLVQIDIATTDVDTVVTRIDVSLLAGTSVSSIDTDGDGECDVRMYVDVNYKTGQVRYRSELSRIPHDKIAAELPPNAIIVRTVPEKLWAAAAENGRGVLVIPCFTSEQDEPSVFVEYYTDLAEGVVSPRFKRIRVEGDSATKTLTMSLDGSGLVAI
jgi:hypothetical protein